MNKKLIILVFALTFIALALAQPPSFHQFYGEVRYDDAGLVTDPFYVRAFLNNTLVEETIIDQSYLGHYGYSPVFLVEGGRDGDIIIFSIDNRFSTNYTFVEEETLELTLIYYPNGSLVCPDYDGDSYSPLGGTCGAADCNDRNAAIHPGAIENCATPYDDNCNGLPNENPPCGVLPDDDDGGGGSTSSSCGAGCVLPKTSFNVDNETLVITVEQGQSGSATFTVSNPTSISRYDVYVSLALSWASLDTNSFKLGPGESRTIAVTVSPDVNIELGSYVDTIKVWTSTSEQREVPLSVNVVSPGSIFDIVVDIPKADLNIWPGELLHASFVMTRLVGVSEEEANVSVDYFIKDSKDNEIFRTSEIRNIPSEDKFDKEFLLPKGIPNGKYVLVSQVVYDDGEKTAVASKWFDVGPKKLDTLRWIIILLILLIAIVSIIISIVIHYRNKAKLPINVQARVQNPATNS